MTTKPTMTRPWKAIAEHYAKVADKSSVLPYDSMLKFVRQIDGSDYAGGLFGWTSHYDLHITQTSVEYPYGGPHLVISPKRHGKVEFRYCDTYSEENQWHRTVDADDAFARLEGFLDQLHWFVKYAPVAETEREQTR